ncbi:TlpA family protein disulfide reductase [Sulfidibacter corallicola]|uniref:TlpA family protein disulfide reductase n=1 Tax=Sulfidibacter corallicola TaxID=2818388 RepID=A0A8A4TPF6_SULCO|nr:TlpA disulfide reductase family protein [Sulfidibacter corallicola]QTD51430.1 TlpA family protein disulfide reductase [Sulfidibacter corallicola]
MMTTLLFMLSTLIVNDDKTLRLQDVLAQVDQSMNTYVMSGQSQESKQSVLDLISENELDFGDQVEFLIKKYEVLNLVGDIGEANGVFARIPVKEIAEPTTIYILLQNHLSHPLISPDFPTTLELYRQLARIDEDTLESCLHKTLARNLFPTPKPEWKSDRGKAFMDALADPDHGVLARASSGIRAAYAMAHATTSEDRAKVLAAKFGGAGSWAPRYRILIANRIAEANSQHARDLRTRMLADFAGNSSLRKGPSTGDDHRPANARRARLRYWYATVAFQLAEAWWPTDRERAMKYYADAAQFSPDQTDRSLRHEYHFDLRWCEGLDDYLAPYAKRLGEQREYRKALDAWLRAHALNPKWEKQLEAAFVKVHPNGTLASYYRQFIDNAFPIAPDLKLTTLTGERWHPETYRGKWVFIDFWGTWCGPCRKEIPQLKAFYQKLTEEANGRATFIAIAMRDQEKTLRRFVQKNGLEYPVAMGEEHHVRNFSVSNYPTKFLVTPNGRLIRLDRSKWLQIATGLVFGSD